MNHDKWLECECTDNYIYDEDDDYEEDHGEPEEPYEDYDRLDYMV